MKSIKCRITKFRSRFYLLYEDGREHQVGDLILGTSLIPVDRIARIFTDFENDGFCSTTYSGMSKLHVKTLPIIAAQDEEIDSKFKKDDHIEFCYIFEEDGQILRNKDNTVIIKTIEECSQ
jgi:hypothetical protein